MVLEYICFLITTDCNMECPYCYRQNSLVTYISDNDYKLFLSKLKILGNKIVNITGGEPLLHNSWRRYIQHAYDTGFSVSLSTNALLLDIDDPILKKIDLLTIPLDGSNQQINSRTRNNNHYFQTISLINKFVQGGYPFKLKINTVMTADNYNNLNEMAMFLSGEGIYWRIYLYKKKGSWNNLPSNKQIGFEDYIKKVKEIQQLNPNVILMIDESHKDAKKELTSTVVTPDGHISLAKNEKDILIGNLRDDEPSQILININNSGLEIEPHRSTIKFAGELL